MAFFNIKNVLITGATVVSMNPYNPNDNKTGSPKYNIEQLMTNKIEKKQATINSHSFFTPQVLSWSS